jgi:hypothetical protein
VAGAEPATDVSVSLQLPLSLVTSSLSANIGTVRVDDNTKVMKWTIGKLSKNQVGAITCCQLLHAFATKHSLIFPLSILLLLLYQARLAPRLRGTFTLPTGTFPSFLLSGHRKLHTPLFISVFHSLGALGAAAARHVYVAGRHRSRQQAHGDGALSNQRIAE